MDMKSHKIPPPYPSSQNTSSCPNLHLMTTPINENLIYYRLDKKSCTLPNINNTSNTSKHPTTTQQHLIVTNTITAASPQHLSNSSNITASQQHHSSTRRIADQQTDSTQIITSSENHFNLATQTKSYNQIRIDAAVYLIY
ncbi:hypothetical protein HYC85_017516 [Camellia sinensis]|uniref:Uncharacterized protein n=1 Tax=Camellia sinensis TaxID=4442 RepID=A0A7J7GRM4_CAMSI|nr:hypothetical protein HYC85_017516 [Camellia sinensis]